MPAFNIPPLINVWAVPLAGILIVSYALSWLARFHWTFDLFSHFMVEYAVGALILCALLLVSQHYVMAFACVLVFIGASVQIRTPMHEPLTFQAPNKTANFTIVQYNKLRRNPNYSGIGKWLRRNVEKYDVVMLQEIGVDDIQKLQNLKDAYKYHFPQNLDQRFNDTYVLSNHPFNVTPVFIGGSGSNKYASRIEIKKSNFAEPVVIYTMHTITPMNGRMQKQRNSEIKNLSKFVSEEKNANVIASGDWNITPYSPYFQDFLKTTHLRYQNYGLLPQTTWPSFGIAPFMKIPIDQVLFNDNLNLISINKGPALLSDHHSLIASFAVKEK